MHNILQLWNQFGSGTYGAFPWQICDFTPKLRSNLSPTILKQQIFEFFARCKPRWTNFCLVGSLGTSQWEASDIWHFFSCDVRKGHHSKARSIERRNLMHADSFLFISRVAASKNHTFFNHFLCLTRTIYRESSHIFAQCPFLTSRSIFGHIWPIGRLMRTIGENIHKTAFTFSDRKKKRFSISENFFRKWVFKRYGNLPKENKLKG